MPRGQRSNVFTRVGRPPDVKSIKPVKNITTGERQGLSPMAQFDSALPRSAFARGGSTNGCKPMPAHHDDPRFCSGGSTRRR